MEPSFAPRVAPAVVKKSDPEETADHALGRSRGGFSAKIHVLCDEHQVHANLISQWKRRLLTNVPRVFEEPEDDARQDHQAVPPSPPDHAVNCKG